MKKLLFRLILLTIVGGAAWYGYKFFQQIPQRQQQQVATAKVRKGDVVVRTYARGELRAVRSVTLTAPNLFGTVQVTRMAALGSLAKEKDLVIEFDDSEVQSRLEESQLELDQIDEQIKKSKADLAIRNNQDQVELLSTRYSVRRAELEVKRNELLAEIDAKKNLLNLEEARRRLKQLESDIQSRQAQAQAELAVLQERRNKSVLQVNRDKQRLLQVKLLSPITGLVAIRQNRAGGFFVPGMQIPDIREGDQVQPGMPVADVLDLSELEVVGRVGELDRANLHEGQDVEMRLDAVPETQLTGKIKSMSSMATSSVFSNDPAKKFDVVFSIDMKQLLTALGAKPDQIQRVLATAEANRKKPIASSASALLSGMPGGMMPGGMMPGGMAGMAGGMAGGGMAGAMPGAMPGGMQAGGGQEAQGARQGGRGFGGAGGGMMAGLTDEQRTKMREVMQKVTGGKSFQDMTPEERASIGAKMQAEMAKLGIERPQGAGGAGGAGAGAAGATGSTGQGSAGAQGAGGERRRGEGGGRRGGDQASGGAGGGLGIGSLLRFTEKELSEAKLPPPPEEDTNLDVLLRPGMLADVEIIVEKIPDALHLPAQAVFEKDGKPIVYLRTGNRFEERPIRIAKRSEATVVIASGVNAGESVALADPFAKPGDKKKKEEKGGGAMGGMPAGGTK